MHPTRVSILFYRMPTLDVHSVSFSLALLALSVLFVPLLDPRHADFCIFASKL